MSDQSMSQAMKTDTRKNQSLEVLKIIAALFVVSIHIRFPGNVGEVFDCLARFAVPLFFSIAGYYSSGIGCHHIRKRLRRIFLIFVFSNLFYLACKAASLFMTDRSGIVPYLIDIFSVKKIAHTVFTGALPIKDHLWYLYAMLLVYLVFWVYTKFFEGQMISYKALYIAGLVGFIFLIAFSVKAAGVGIVLPLSLYRNALFFGLPLFSTGLFLNEYRNRLTAAFPITTAKGFLLIGGGLLLSLLQWFGIGKSEFPLGMMIVVPVMMLLTQMHPNLPFLSKKAEKLLPYFSQVALVIYIIHPFFDSVISTLHERSELLNTLYSAKYIYPIFIMMVSLLTGIVYSIVSYSIRKRSK